MCSIPGNGFETRGDFACAQAGCCRCQDALVREHTGLIHALLRRVAHIGVPYAELVQEGRLALWRAVLGFDPGRGVRFATYGSVAIERALWAAVRQAQRGTEVPLPAATPPEPWAVYSQQAEVQAALRGIVAQLPERLGAVVTALYGLDGQPPYTQAALGRAWGLSRERMRQLHMEALVTLRHPGLSSQLYQLCERDSRAAYLQALQRNRAWQRRRRR
jgi:RNA polymerase primary sigma factor